jgi:hypothetical protein
MRLERQQRLRGTAGLHGCVEPDPLGIVQVQQGDAVEAEPVQAFRKRVVGREPEKSERPGWGSTFVAST